MQLQVTDSGLARDIASEQDRRGDDSPEMTAQKLLQERLMQLEDVRSSFAMSGQRIGVESGNW